MEEKLTLTVKEASEMTGIGVAQMYTLTRREDFPAIRLGRKVLILRSGLETWLAKVANGEVLL